MNPILQSFSEQLGMNVFLFALIMIWTAAWKLLALWKAARNKHMTWFIMMALINTIGILPILYIFLFQDLSKREDKIEEVKPNKKVVKKKKVSKTLDKKSK